MKKFITILIIALFLFQGCSRHSIKQDGVNPTVFNDSVLLDLVEKQTFQYFWEGAEPNSGLARERINMDGVYPENDQDIVTTGGSGFGVMALIAGIDRGYITREEGIARFEKIVSFLEKADRFHGAWPHWINGKTGKIKPFGNNDDGGDLVESSFLLQGLLAARQYFQNGSEKEKAIAQKINKLWKEVDFNWYRKDGQNVLYWHWSPDKAWIMNFPVRGYNECMIMYILAAASPFHGISANAYHEGWADNGKIKHVANYKSDTLHLLMQANQTNGGPLFWSHYSFLGLNPFGLKDQYADYGKEMTTMSKINYQWCVDNPKKFKGYDKNNWGLTASYSVKGYAAHSPNYSDDLGVIAPTAAVSSIVYTPKESIEAIKYWYTHKKEKLWGPYGFYDAFSETDNWYPKKYLAIDQGPQVVMIENYRSGLLWKLFMSCSEVQNGLKKLGFQ
ncbi:MAG: beta-glucosidase [Pseudopedobacter saltans]|uniref:Beta-glucosidase n=1 Tax=Pseudopedobacter saltans TaxID=151895 RepID=A0A2W5FCA4_9SPHI|nr:MAG: beta-glucosidase [Pseudopedobacter saltans]